MKKIMLLFPVLMTGFFIYAQSNNDTLMVRYQYCEVVGWQKPLSQKINITVDFGEAKTMSSDQTVRDEITNKAVDFNSMVDAMNYMSDRGWDFVNAYIVSGQSGSVYRWLLRRKMGKGESFNIHTKNIEK